MINYTLKCAQGHEFDSWFSSAADFDTLAQGGHLSCAVCGVSDVTKSLMAPRVGTAKAELTSPASERETAIGELRRTVEENADYVGADFVTQARGMHDGTTPERPIYGEAKLEQAKALVEDGVPVMPLPFAPKRKLS